MGCQHRVARLLLCEWSPPNTAEYGKAHVNLPKNAGHSSKSSEVPDDESKVGFRQMFGDHWLRSHNVAEITSLNK